MRQMQPETHTTALRPEQSRPTLAGKTVLIADDDEALLRALDIRCRHLGLRVETATDGLRTLLKVTKEKPDLLILDLNLPDVDGFKVVERLSDPKFPPLPVIVLTGRSDEAAIQRCEELNVFYVHKGPNTWADLEPLIFDVFRSKLREPKPETQQTTAPRVLLIDDNRLVLKMMAQSLEKYQLEVIQATSGMQGFWLALKKQPDLIITDYNMEHGSGHYLLSRIKSTPSTQHIPVIIYTGTPLAKGQQFAIERDLRGRGQAAAFLTKSKDPAGLIAEVRKHIALPSQG